MSKKILTTTIVFLLALTIATPAAFFVAPKKASADSGAGCVVGLAAGLGLVTTNKVVAVPVGDAAGGAGSWTTAGSTVGSCVYNLMIVPMLRQMIRTILQDLTKATINWINGANGTGQPSFVQNLSVHLRQVADSAALSFIAQIGAGVVGGALNNPYFGKSISSALTNIYTMQTSLAGFFAEYQCTLAKASNDANRFLAGDWSQGGAGAWFALTTQNQNNPYTLYQASLDQLGRSVSQVTGNRQQELTQSGGFLSFCPSDSAQNSTANCTSGNGTEGSACCSSDQCDASAGLLCNTSTYTCVSEKSIGSGASPQAQCTNKDGTPANATTPGSTIKSYLDANLGSGIGQLVSAQDLDGAIGGVVVALANKVLGPNGLIFGASQSSSSYNTTPTTQTQSSAAASAGIMATSALANITAYTDAFQVIKNAEQTAASSLSVYIQAAPGFIAQTTSVSTTTCSEQQLAVQTVITHAQTALDQAKAMLTSTGTVGSALVAANTAFADAATTETLALKVQTESSPSIVPANPTQFSADVVALTNARPSQIDAINAQADAETTGNAVTLNWNGTKSVYNAPVPITLSVSGGTITDRMSLISANADALISSFQSELNTAQSACNSYHGGI